MGSTSLSTNDARPFFERALRFGVQSGAITKERLQKILADGPKGIVQIANYFGTSNLRTELENAKERMVNLLSLHLEDQSNGDLHSAASVLEENGLLFLSKCGSDMLRRLSALPSVAILESHRKSAEDQRNDLNEWTLSGALGLKMYRDELLTRQSIQAEIEFARWILKRFGATAMDDRFAIEAQAVFNSAVLVLFFNDAPLEMPTPVGCVRLINAVKKRSKRRNDGRWAVFLAEVPPTYLALANKQKEEFQRISIPKIRESGRSAEDLLYGEDALQVFMREDLDHDSSEYERLTSKVWHRVTSGEADDQSVIATILLRVAVGLAPKSRLLKREAREIVSAFRLNGFDSDAVIHFIETHAPLQSQPGLKQLWSDDLATDASDALADSDPEFPDKYMARAVAYLRRTCRASWVLDDR